MCVADINSNEYIILPISGIVLYGVHRTDGLDVHPVDWYMSFLEDHKFNSIRFFIQIQGVNQNQRVPQHVEHWGQTDHDHIKHAPYLEGLTYVGMIKRLAQDMAKRGILVMLANHRLTPHTYPGAEASGYWYSDEIPVDAVKRAWTRLAEELCEEWNVFAVDPQNEPWRSSWGLGDPAKDWNLGAEDLGNRACAALFADERASHR